MNEFMIDELAYIFNEDRDVMEDMMYDYGLFDDDEDEEEYIPSSENGDYSPTHPWDAPGMSISDFI